MHLKWPYDESGLAADSGAYFGSQSVMIYYDYNLPRDLLSRGDD